MVENLHQCKKEKNENQKKHAITVNAINTPNIDSRMFSLVYILKYRELSPS